MKRLVFIALYIAGFFGNVQGQSNNNNITSVFLSRLPIVPDGTLWCGQFSSHSPNQQNGDVNHFLYRDAQDDAVIFDVRAPGCIKSMWATALDSSAVLKFYFDDENSPRYTIRAIDFYQGRLPGFSRPLVAYQRRGYYIRDSYAGNSFAPIFFQRSLRISVKGNPSFYHILYEKYPYGTKIDPAKTQEQHDFVLAAFGNQKTSVAKYPAQQIQSKLLPRQEINLFRQPGSGSIRSIEIETDTSAAFLKDVFIGMIWDEATQKDDKAPRLAFEATNNSRQYQVLAPIGMFFATPDYVLPVQSLPLSVERSGKDRLKLTCRFVMPYWRNARIILQNRSERSFSNIQSKIVYDATPYPENKTGYFTTFYRKGITEYGKDWLFFASPGTGWYVGTVQTCRLEHYCEGNEHFYMDGNRTPQINGTGTEDYYLGCFWPSKTYHSPFAGSVNDVRRLSGGDTSRFLTIFKEDYLFPAAYYRFHLEMPLPFYNAIDAKIQHGAEDNIASEYSSLAYAYLKSTPSLSETDFIDVGNASSRAFHGYHCSDMATPVSLLARYEGDNVYTTIQDEGLSHKGGRIRFTISIDPDNAEVRLRRRMDQAIARQEADVYIDGVFAGTWYDPQCNPVLRWYDSEFLLPSHLTKQKKQLAVELRVHGMAAPFSDFEYRAFCYKRFK
ncbi:DUF2961 domain-containing protein [Niabella soli]|uniref:DUF2961 domain-containing protein n=1 Tax=Niabella soli DSM 19437 TaxID=929713 RepID=W0F2M4_9BACT|nr:DUF2961 domain-containing protein [Niabella soli]AHF17267.1 hypothetical protein NIASO_04895 [Niabella soli DSM 19437]